MLIDDDRTPEEKRIYCVLVIGTDKILSGWGKAAGGVFYAAWGCTPGTAESFLRDVRGVHQGMKRWRVVHEGSRPYRPRAKGHLHIHVYRPWAEGVQA
jgi:hypothetical protein